MPVIAQVFGIPTIEVHPQGGSFLVKTDSPSVWAAPSTWIALGAASISAVSLLVTLFDKWWGHRKDLRSREQSIQDEFWLRKVMFPSAIEPAMLFMANTISDLPASQSSSDDRLAYFAIFQSTHRVHARKLLLVATMWPDVYKKLNIAFEKIEDAVADYCNSPADDAANATPHTEATNAINLALSSFCVAIRDHQKSIK